MFYDYHQNNSGGGFCPAINVIVEANNASEADYIAESNGLYFNGVEDGSDCACCGDRWYNAYGIADAVPSIYGKPITEPPSICHNKEGRYSDWAKEDLPSIIVYYLNGDVQVIK